jgi:TrmH family RNA methyltransferase
MLSKNQLKRLRGLQRKKERKITGLFVVEGKKIVEELLQSSTAYVELYATCSWFDNNPTYLAKDNSYELSDRDLGQVSTLKTPNEVLLVLKQQVLTSFDVVADESLVLALDGVSDPGNLGTIIRLADWFGVEHILCTSDTVDQYNPKTVQSAMGSINRIQMHYGDLSQMLSNLSSHTIYASDLKGESIYTTSFAKNSILLMGSESHGISDEILSLDNKKITIPTLSKSGIDSLNVATATAIVLSEFRSKL